MGLKRTRDFSQQAIEEELNDVQDTGADLDNIGVISMTWVDNILLLEKSSIKWKPMLSQSSHLIAIEPSKELIVLDIDSHPLV